MKILIDSVEKVAMPDSGYGPWTQVKIKSGSKMYSAPLKEWNANLKAGDETNVNIVEKRKGDKVYLNLTPIEDKQITLPLANPQLDRIEILCKQILQTVLNTNTGLPVDDEEIPF